MGVAISLEEAKTGHTVSAASKGCPEPTPLLTKSKPFPALKVSVDFPRERKSLEEPCAIGLLLDLPWPHPL